MQRVSLLTALGCGEQGKVEEEMLSILQMMEEGVPDEGSEGAEGGTGPV